LFSLVGNTEKLQIVQGTAVALHVHVSGVEVLTTFGTSDSAVTFTQNTITASGTTDICAVPTASTKTRNMKLVFVKNTDATTSTTIKLKHVGASTTVDGPAATLYAGWTALMTEGLWDIFDATGARVTGAVSGALTVKYLTADQSNSTTTPTSVTGIKVTTGVGSFYFRYAILYQSSATGTGVKFSVNHTGTVSSFVANRYIVGAATAATDAAADQDVVTAAGGIISVMAARAKSTGGWGTSISVDTANADMLEMIEGLMIVTVAGDLELWHGSETAAATTTKAGSSLMLIQVA
jgi:hypothetical protein